MPKVNGRLTYVVILLQVSRDLMDAETALVGATSGMLLRRILAHYIEKRFLQ